MAYTQADLDAIDAALLRGEKRVVYTSSTGVTRDVTYRDTAEMLAVRSLVARSVATTTGGPRFSVATFRD